MSLIFLSKSARSRIKSHLEVRKLFLNSSGETKTSYFLKRSTSTVLSSERILGGIRRPRPWCCVGKISLQNQSSYFSELSIKQQQTKSYYSPLSSAFLPLSTSFHNVTVGNHHYQIRCSHSKDNADEANPVSDPVSEVSDITYINNDNNNETITFYNSATKDLQQPNDAATALVPRKKMKTLLKEYYLKEFGISDDISTSCKANYFPFCNGFLWNATFTCPVSGIEYPSATLRAVTSPGRKVLAADKDQMAVLFVKDKTLYNSILLAEEAAFACALDRIQFEQSGLTEPRHCEEDPSTPLSSMRNSSSESIQKQADQIKLLHDNGITWHDLIKDEDEETAEDVKKCLRRLTFNGPLFVLNLYYEFQHGIPKISSQFHAIKNPNDTSLWTSNFKCPLSGKIYPSGFLRYRGYDKPHKMTNIYNKAVYIEEDGTVYYFTRNAARAAAAARALDSFQFEFLGLTEPRLCEEDPSNPILTTIHFPIAVIEPPSNESIHNENNNDEIVESERKEELDYIIIDIPSNSGEKSPATKILEASNNLSLTKPPLEKEKENDSLKEYITRVDITRVEPTGTDSIHSIDHQRVTVDDSEFSLSLSPVVNAVEEIPCRNEETNEIINGQGNEEIEFIVMDAASFGVKSASQRILEAATSSASRASIPRDPWDNNEYHMCQLPKFIVYTERPSALAIKNAKKFVSTMSIHLQSSNDKQREFFHKMESAPIDSPTNLLIGKAVLYALAEANQGLPFQINAGIEPIAKQVVEVLWQTNHAKPDAAAYTAYLKCLEGDNPFQVAQRAHEILLAMQNGTKWEGRILPKPDQSTYNAVIQLDAQVGGSFGRFRNLNNGNFVPDRQSFLSLLSASTYRAHLKDKGPSGFDPEFAKECIGRMIEMAEETGDYSFIPDIDVYNAPLRWAGGDSCWRHSRPYAHRIFWDSYEEFHAGGYRSLPENGCDADSCWKEAELMHNWLNEMKQSSQNGGVAPNIETFEAVIQAWLRTVTREGLDRADTIAQKLLEEDSCYGRARLQTFHPVVASWFHAKDPDSPNKVDEWISRLLRISDEQNKPELRPDMRMFSVLLLSKVKRQEEFLKRILDGRKANMAIAESISINSTSSDFTSDELVEEIVRQAMACSETLRIEYSKFEHISASGKGNTVFFDILLFAHGIKAWKNVASAALLGHKIDNNLFDQAVNEMYDSITDLQRLIEMVVKRESPQGINLDTETVILFQLKHIMIYLPAVASVFIESLTALQKEQNDLIGSDLLGQSLLIVEGLTRQVMELDEIAVRSSLVSPGDATVDSRFRYEQGKPSIRYDDLFRYFHEQRSIAIPALVHKVIDYATNIQQPKHWLGDIARLCALIRNFGKARKRSKTEDRVVRLLQSLISHGALLAPNQEVMTSLGKRGEATSKREEPSTNSQKEPKRQDNAAGEGDQELVRTESNKRRPNKRSSSQKSALAAATKSRQGRKPSASSTRVKKSASSSVSSTRVKKSASSS